MREFEHPLARARKRRGARWRRDRLALVAVAAAILVLAGGDEGRDRPGRNGPMSIPSAEAAGLREAGSARDDLRADRAVVAAAPVAAPPSETALPRSAATRTAATSPVPPAASDGRTAAAMPEGGLSAILFQPASLIGAASKAAPPQASSGIGDTPLRRTTEAALPLDGMGETLAPSLPPPTARRSPEAPAPRLAGTWAVSAAACDRRNAAYMPIVIDAKGAKAGSSSCAFGTTRRDGNRFAIAARCRSGAERWSANVRLVVEGRRLTWSSERGTETYQRCG